MLSYMDLVSHLQDQDVVRVVQQQRSVSTTLHTASFLVTQWGHPVSHFKARHCELDCWYREDTLNEMQPKINQKKFNLYSLKCEEAIWEIWASLNLPPLLQTLKCSAACCYDNLIIVYHGCTLVCLPLWGSGKIMCECEVVLFGRVSNVRL